MPIGDVNPPAEYYGQDHPGPQPDPLAPSGNYVPGGISVREGEVQPLWLLFYAPAGTAAGDYAGTLTIREGGSIAARVSLSSHVWDYPLPAEMHLPAALKETFRAIGNHLEKNGGWISLLSRPGRPRGEPQA